MCNIKFQGLETVKGLKRKKKAVIWSCYSRKGMPEKFDDENRSLLLQMSHVLFGLLYKKEDTAYF